MTFNIDLDYSFTPPPGSLFDLARPAGTNNAGNPIPSGLQARNAIREAAATWESFIKDEFATVPSGLRVDVIDPNAQPNQLTGVIPVSPISLTSSIDDIRIFIGSRTIGNGTFAVAELGRFSQGSYQQDVDYGYLTARQFGLNSEPYVGSISFTDQFTPSSALSTGNTSYNLYVTALHEIGHLLGFYADPINILSNPSAFAYGINTLSNPATYVGQRNLTSGVNLNNPFGGHFNRAINLTNRNLLGNSLTGDVFGAVRSSRSGAVPNSLGSNNSALMGAGIPIGPLADRFGITDQDLAFLADVGYQIDLTSPIPLSAPISPVNNRFNGFLIGGTNVTALCMTN